MARRNVLRIAIWVVVLLCSSWAFSKETIGNSSCGNGICEESENNQSCKQDCCSDIYPRLEQACLKKGWDKITIDVATLSRKALVKKPTGFWSSGAIIVLHGGGGSHSNFCGDVSLNKPMGDFSDLAVREGFAVFSLDSAVNVATDPQGRGIGKRWDSLATENRKNVDLPFIEKVITQVIPSLRPEKSAKGIYLTGISNGGFMTTLAATHLSDKIQAFAPVSAGDPYGTYFDMGTKPPLERRCAPGLWRDNETLRSINEKGACTSEKVSNEKPWKGAVPVKKPPFKQFHHEGDGGCDFSCMEKAKKQLIQQGYRDAGAFVIKSANNRSIMNHFWKEQYNPKIIEFFKENGAGNSDLVE